MKKNRGFTLIELLAVIIILAGVALIAFPVILNSIKNSEKQIDEKTKKLVTSAAELYVDSNLNNYPSVNGNTYCLSIEELIQSKYLEKGIIDATKIDLSNKTVKITVSDKHTYEVVNTSECKSIVKEMEGTTPTKPSFANDSWDTIATYGKIGKAAEVYKIGDTKKVTLTGFGTYTVRIANFPEQNLFCELSDSSQTACGFVIEFVDIITKHSMSSTLTSAGGWKASEMREYINSTIYNSLPTDLKNVIVDTKVVSSHNKDEYSNFETIDKLYLLSTGEVLRSDGSSTSTTGDSAEGNTRQLDYYSNLKVTTSDYSSAIKKYNGSPTSWALRSANRFDSTYFYSIYTDGSRYNYYPNVSLGVSPAFRIGKY